MTLVGIGTRSTDGAVTLAMKSALERATLCRALAVVFRPPTPTLSTELRALASALPKELAARFEGLAEVADQTGGHMDDLYHRTLGAGGGAPGAESDHLPWRTMGGKGALLGDVAAFYAAFAFDPTAELRDSPDNLALELSFLGWLHLKTAHALHAGRTEEVEVTEAAVAKFTEEHLATWLDRFVERLEERAPDTFYGIAARVLATVLSFEPKSSAPPRGAPDQLAFAGVPLDDAAGAPHEVE